MTREQLEARILELSRTHTATHDEDVKAELEKLRKHVAKWKSGYIRVRPTSPRPLRKRLEIKASLHQSIFSRLAFLPSRLDQTWGNQSASRTV